MERYALYHIQTKDQQKHLVAVGKWKQDAICSDEPSVRIRFVKQPPYIHQGTHYADHLFIERIDEGGRIELAYEKETHSCNVSADMLQPVTRKEIADFLHYAIFTNFGKVTDEKSDKSLRFEQMVLSEAISALYETAES